ARRRPGARSARRVEGLSDRGPAPVTIIRGVPVMPKKTRSSSQPTSFRPAVEALEDRLVPSGAPPVVGLTLANDLVRSSLVVEQAPQAQIEPLVRLCHTVGEVAQTG